jgi:formylglycine-generating enzyme required for sulfatase activity
MSSRRFSLKFGKYALFAMLAGAGTVSAQISGTVTNQITGKPLAGALVTRLSDTARAVTDSTGYYHIGTTAVLSGHGTVASPAVQPKISGDVLRFTAASAQDIAVQRFSLNGRLEATLFSGHVQSGSYVVNLGERTGSSNGVSITRLKLNGANYSFTTAAFGNGIATSSGATGGSAAGKGIAGTALVQAAAVAVTDSVYISRFGYRKVSLPITGSTISTALDTTTLFVSVAGGTFTQGTNDTTRNATQRPAHSVTLSSFLLNKYATTFDDYDAFALATGISLPKASTYGGRGGGRNPVIYVTWYNAIQYANWQSLQDGLTPVYTIDSVTKDTNNIDTSDHSKWTITANWNFNGYRLPTEAEYEYAADGGSLTHGYLFAGSNNLDSVAWTGLDTLSNGTYVGFQPVGTKKPNELGMYDLSGDGGYLVWDKALSTNEANYPDSAVINPRGLDGSHYDRHVKRGGGYMSGAVCNYTTARHFKKSKGSDTIGFRLARSK